jgi:hypothetical protein
MILFSKFKDKNGDNISPMDENSISNKNISISIYGQNL